MDKQVPHSLVRSLRAIPDFSALDDPTLLQIVGESMNLFWKAGSPIFEPGSPGDALYVVLSGEIAIYDGGKEVSHPGSGDFFGEISLLTDATHTKSARAVTDSEVLVLPKEAFKAVLDSNPKLAGHFQRVVDDRRSENGEPVS